MSFRNDVIAPAPFATTRATSARRIARQFPPMEHVSEQAWSQLSAVSQVVSLWLQRRRDRAILRSLSQRDLHDFCPRHDEAEAEMNKPFWQA